MLITAWCRWCAIYKKCCCIKDLWGGLLTFCGLYSEWGMQRSYMIKLNLSARITSIRMFSCAVEIEYHGQGKIKSKQCWDIKISQRGCEMRGISCRGSFSYHREGQPGSEEESIEVKLFSKQATLQVPSGCLIRQMLCVRRPSSNFIQLWALWALPCFSSAVWKCQHS